MVEGAFSKVQSPGAGSPNMCGSIINEGGTGQKAFLSYLHYML